jgi:hypothetical protein
MDELEQISLRGTQVARVTVSFQDGEGKSKRVAFSFPGDAKAIAPGAAVPLLVHPESRYAAAFAGGRAIAAK